MTEILLGLVTPFRDIVTGPAFFVEVLLGGIAAGLMYSLVTLGFVLIFKASGVFNFAQGVMVLFAALTLVGLMDRGVPVAIALALTIGVMIALALAIERVVLRPLVNQAALVAIAAGIMWGAKSGVQFSLSLIALKALPVLILGGFTSVPGAIAGGLIIGVGEKVAEVYWGPLVGGAIENWFAYALALVFLLFRPQGLFGEKIIERV